MTVIDFSTLEIYKKLPLIQIILRGMNGISLRHFLWKNISENLVDSEIKAKKKLYLTIILNPYHLQNLLRSIYLELNF